MSDLHVIFGAGPVGQATARQLVKNGKRVRMVNRSGQRPADVPEAVEMLAGDAYSHDFARQAVEGTRVVYQAAQPAYHEWPEKFPPLQASILQAVASIRGKIVVTENLYMYGDVDGELHEDLPLSAQTRKGKTRAAMTGALMEAHRSGKVRAVAVRGSDFYGQSVVASAMGERVFLPALKGKAVSLTGNVDLPHTFTFIEDFGKAMVLLGEHEQADGQTWHVPSAPTVSQRQLAALLFEEIGQPMKISVLGKPMLQLAGLFIPAARETVEMMYEFDKPFCVSHAKFEKVFGAHPTPHREALRATVAWYRRRNGN